MISEFKKFLMRGNVIDLAVAVIIGGAFNKIVTSLVNDVIMPLVGIIIGGRSFESLFVEVGTAKLSYGLFIQSVVDFLIIGTTIFVFIKALEKARRKKPEEVVEEPVLPSNEEVLLSEIRDILKSQNTVN